MRTESNRQLMKSNRKKIEHSLIKKAPKSKSVSGEPFSSSIGATFRFISKLQNKPVKVNPYAR